MKRLLTSCFGLGWLPIASGTWGSIPPAATFYLMAVHGASANAIAITMTALIIIGSFICVKFAPASIAATNSEDPSEVVADELAGQAVTFLIIALTPIGNIFITALAGFLLFRFFDILKPWPIRKLEKLPKGWGILADDLLAGVYAGIILLLLSFFCLPGFCN